MAVHPDGDGLAALRNGGHGAVAARPDDAGGLFLFALATSAFALPDLIVSVFTEIVTRLVVAITVAAKELASAAAGMVRAGKIPTEPPV